MCDDTGVFEARHLVVGVELFGEHGKRLATPAEGLPDVAPLLLVLLDAEVLGTGSGGEGEQVVGAGAGASVQLGGGRTGPAEAELIHGDVEVLGEQPPVERLGPGHLAAFPAADGLLGDLDLAAEPALREFVERVSQVFLRQASVVTQSDQVGVECSEVGWLGHDRQSKPPVRRAPRCPLDVPELALLWASSVVVRSSSGGFHWPMSPRTFWWLPVAGQRHAILECDRAAPTGEPVHTLCGQTFGRPVPPADFQWLWRTCEQCWAEGCRRVRSRPR